MARLEDELMHTLVQNKLCFEPEYVSESPIYDGPSIVSYEDDHSVENASQRDRSSSSETDEYATDLIHPDVIPQIKSIADTMFTSGYEPEFCRAFTAFWRDTLAEYMTALDVEQLSIEDVLGMEWKCLNSRIKKWIVAIKCIIRVYFVSAKRVFDQVFQEHGHIISSTCLVEASKAHLLCLLNFGQAVSIGPHKPESLFCLLDMYEVISALTPDVDALFPEGIGSMARIEFRELSTRLRDSAMVVWNELGAHVASCSSSTPFANGGIHHLTKYVMNYILFFEDYGDTLDLLLQGQNGPNNVSTRLQSLTSTLEANLENKSNLYKDCSLKHIFMMNNIHYMVQKIRNSKIGPYFGDEWVRTHVGKFRQHAMFYERVTWNSMLSLLQDDGKTGKSTLKARCRAFVVAFEGVYKSQTRWCVPDCGLREDLRISASKTVIQAYRNFVNRINNSIGEKHIKYTEHELGTYILDLLEGSSKSLNHSQKR
ncbi:exocyst complex component exo70a1 [Phtheirospermum japonicum]|uniref:Exocyst subunit Exo70 family protein n=1 Tax=Phtheirospermum japonicum TaxID=374723 RepID=A0A830BV52_9LAMI|nr:exocyst complex component exo70a1 [Phtheirospermum japonicum]